MTPSPARRPVVTSANRWTTASSGRTLPVVPAAAPTPRATSFAYVVLAHTDPRRVLAAVQRIQELSPGARVLVRHTRGSGFLPARELAAAGAQELHSRLRVGWGTWSLTAAVLEALRTAEERWQPRATVVVSGQDHPVRDLRRWEEGILERGTDALLRPDPRDYVERYRDCWHEVPGGELLPPRWVGSVARLSERAGDLVGGPRLRLAGGRTLVLGHRRGPGCPAAPEGMVYRKGSLWMTLSARAVQHLLAAEQDRAVQRYFASTLVPDESFAHSVLGALPGLLVEAGPTSWPFFPPGGGAHPRSVVLSDLEAVRDSGAAFTRKVVSPVSDAFVHAVDALVDADRAAAGCPG